MDAGWMRGCITNCWANEGADSSGIEWIHPG